jgi:hypothetical protein
MAASDTIMGGTGDPFLTKKLRVQYGKENVDAQTQGQDLPPWEQWVSEQGYALDRAGLVYKPQKPQK